MAQLNAPIIAKASGTAGEAPQAADLQVAELAVNTADKKLFTKHTDGSIVTISGGGGGVVDIGDLGDVTITGEFPSRSYAEGTETNSGEYRSSYVSSSNQGLFINKTDFNGELTSDLIPPGFVFGPTDTPGVIRVASNFGGPFTDYSFNGITDEGASYRVYGASGGGLGLISGFKYFLLDTTPEGAISNESILTYDGTSQAWVNQRAQINILTDVDTSTTPPTDGQTLAWVDANSKWEPADIAAGVSIVDLNDFDYALDPAANVFTLPGPTSTNPTSSGVWGIGSGLNNFFTWFDTDPINAWLSTLPSGSTIQFVTEGGYVHTAVTSNTASENGANSDYLSFSGYPWPTEMTDAMSAGESITVQEPNPAKLPLADGDILEWDATDSKFKPTALDAAGTRTLLGIGEYADDTAAGTGGVASGALYYNTTSSDYRLKS